jgi:large subunit ribosomal protein L35
MRLRRHVKIRAGRADGDRCAGLRSTVGIAITRGFAQRARRGWTGACCHPYGSAMPKLKTKSGAKKRFGRTGAGKIKRNWGYKRHRLISKSKQGKRLRRGTTTLEKGDSKLVLTYMPYLRG